MTPTSLVRIRFPLALIELLDQLAERLRVKSRRKIPRAAIIRALVQIQMRRAPEEGRPELNEALAADPVRHGREKRAEHRILFVEGDGVEEQLVVGPALDDFSGLHFSGF